MLQWHHNPALIRMLDHHQRGNSRSLSSNKAPTLTRPPMPPVLLFPTPPTQWYPQTTPLQPPQQAPPTQTQRFSHTPARVPPSHQWQATPPPGPLLVLPLVHIPLSPHFPGHRLGSLVPRLTRTQVHILMEGIATPRAPTGHQPSHQQVDLFIGQVLESHNNIPEPLCVRHCLFLSLLSHSSLALLLLLCLSLLSDLWFVYPCHILFLSEALKEHLRMGCACYPLWNFKERLGQRLCMGFTGFAGSVPDHLKHVSQTGLKKSLIC